MRRAAHILSGAGLAVVLMGCAAPVLDKYMGRSIVDPMLDFGQPAEVFELPDGRRAYQWEVDKQASRPSPRPVLGVGIGVGRGGWGHVTTVGTSYETYTKTCRYTLIAARRGNGWIVTDQRKPAPGCA